MPIPKIPTHLVNWSNPAVSVRHADLPKVSEESPFKVSCPTCDGGLLLVQRDDKFKVTRLDRCVACGQVVYYLDEQIAGEPLPFLLDQKPDDPPKPESIWDRLKNDT